MVAPKNVEDEVYRAVETGLLKIDSEGRIWRMWPTRRRAEKSSGDYLQVRVMTNGIRHHALAHRLVWRHFMGPIPAGLTINHENGKKQENAPSNLTLATYSEQAIHSRRVLGQHRQDGALNNQAKLTPAFVAEIRQRRAAGEPLKSIALSFNVSDRTISKIARGQRWTG